MKKLLILAIKYSNTEEADRVFERRGWRKVSDRTKALPVSNILKRSRKETSLFDLIIEEIEYLRR